MKLFLSIISLGIFVSLAFPHGSYAATDVVLREEIENSDSSIILHMATDAAVNAIEGRIILPAGAIVQRVSDGTIPVLWIERPAVGARESVSFAIAIPGGYVGEGDVVRIQYRGGSGHGSLADVHAFQNDGSGNSLAVTTGVRQSTRAENVADKLPPDAFIPEITRDSSLFDGQWFMVFQTTDKQSGIDHYEVMEVLANGGGELNRWNDAQSPYRLIDQTRSADIYVRAVDRAGNFIIVHIPVSKEVGRNNSNLVRGIEILLVVVLILWIGGYIRSRLRLLRAR